MATHGILSGDAVASINASCLAGFVMTNSWFPLVRARLLILLAVPLGDKVERCPKLKVLDVSAILGEVGRGGFSCVSADGL